MDDRDVRLIAYVTRIKAEQQEGHRRVGADRQRLDVVGVETVITPSVAVNRAQLPEQPVYGPDDELLQTLRTFLLGVGDAGQDILPGHHLTVVVRRLGEHLARSQVDEFQRHGGRADVDRRSDVHCIVIVADLYDLLRPSRTGDGGDSVPSRGAKHGGQRTKRGQDDADARPAEGTPQPLQVRQVIIERRRLHGDMNAFGQRFLYLWLDVGVGAVYLSRASLAPGRYEDAQLALRIGPACQDVTVRRGRAAVRAFHQHAALPTGPLSPARGIDVHPRGHRGVEDRLALIHLHCDAAGEEGHPVLHAPNND